MACRFFSSKSSDKPSYMSDILSRTSVNGLGVTKRPAEKKHIRHLKPLTSLVLSLAIVKSRTNSVTADNEKQNNPRKQLHNRNKTDTCKEAELSTKV